MDTSTTSSKESTDSQNEKSKTFYRKKEDESSPYPFKLLGAFGMNSEVPLINLTTENRTIIAYACSHAVVFYNYELKETITLQGHQNAVRTLSVSEDGKWLLTADFEKDSAVVVWDTESCIPVCTLFNPHVDKELSAAKISPNAKYIVTVGNERYQRVKFWLWTYGKDEPNDCVELTEINLDRVKEISFNKDLSEEFALTADHTIIFFIWEHSNLKYYYPKVFGNVRRYGIFNATCYLSSTHQVLTATSNGYILVWCKKRHSKIAKNEKEHVKSVQLQKNSITVILNHNGVIVTGTSVGRINFYDLHLRILYWCQDCGLDSIRSISFDLHSSVMAPVSAISESEFEISKDDLEYEEEFEECFESKMEGSVCSKKIKYLKQTGLTQTLHNVRSVMTINLEPVFRNYDKRHEEFTKPPHIPTDATLGSAPFYIENFFVSCSSGLIALIEIPALKCRLISHNVGGSITSLDCHPQSNFLVTGNTKGLMCLYDYKNRNLMISRKTPPLPDFHILLDDQMKRANITYVTCPQSHEKLTAVTVLKYSLLCDLLACGLENGTLWMLHPITLEPLDDTPYKHSSEAILQLIFTDCSEYMAYSDNTLVVVVFKRNHDLLNGPHIWNFIGKYRSHYAPIRDILFGPPNSNSVAPRLFSLGEDQNLIEYDLNNSGPYPDPGLLIKEIHKIEYTAIPLCLSWYPQFGIEGFLMMSNSEYKYRLLNDMTKMIRGTFLGPIFGAPVQHFQVLKGKEVKADGYIIFTTEKEIGLQMIPFDGNPYKILGIVGHPRKVTSIAVNCDGNIVFTSGYNDPCVLMWKIKYRSVEVLARLGGASLSPYYCLIEGGRKGWLINEMKDLFYYAQILHQGENTTATRIVSEKVSTKQIPNLMRAIGYYLSNEEIEILMGEISYRNYAETGHLVEEISFEDFIKLYVNHRPAFGISLQQLQETFQFLSNSSGDPFLYKNSSITREQFLNILFGKGLKESLQENQKLFGEPLTQQEAYMYLKFLTGFDDLHEIFNEPGAKRSVAMDFSFLPERISYKDFAMNIMGIEETRAEYHPS